MNTSVKNWVIKAGHDLKIALDAIKSEEPITDGICFHCQQCVEKFLKAYLAFNKELIPKTHDLTNLIHLCTKIDKDFEYLFSIEVDRLTEYAIEIRYPDDFYIPTLEEAKEAIELAEETKEFVLKKLIEKGFQI